MVAKARFLLILCRIELFGCLTITTLMTFSAQVQSDTKMNF